MDEDCPRVRRCQRLSELVVRTCSDPSIRTLATSSSNGMVVLWERCRFASWACRTFDAVWHMCVGARCGSHETAQGMARHFGRPFGRFAMSTRSDEV